MVFIEKAAQDDNDKAGAMTYYREDDIITMLSRINDKFTKFYGKSIMPTLKMELYITPTSKMHENQTLSDFKLEQIIKEVVDRVKEST